MRWEPQVLADSQKRELRFLELHRELLERDPLEVPEVWVVVVVFF